MRGVPGLLRRRARQGASEAERLRAAMIPAPVAESEARPGSFTPEAKRQLDEARAAGIARYVALRGDSPFEAIGEAFEAAGGLFPEAAPPVLGAPAAQAPPVPEVKTGGRPYSAITARQLAAYRDAAASELLTPGPGFEPGPSVAPVTAPMPALRGNAKVPPPPPARPARHAGTGEADLVLLTRIRDGLEKKWRIEAFLADKKSLPCFAATTKAAGWLGLHLPPRPIGWQEWSTAPWARQERALADAAYAQARAELDAVHARHAAQALADGDAA